MDLLLDAVMHSRYITRAGAVDSGTADPELVGSRQQRATAGSDWMCGQASKVGNRWSDAGIVRDKQRIIRDRKGSATQNQAGNQEAEQG